MVGTTRSEFNGREFEVAQCPVCHFSFVIDPRTDFDTIYDAAYYRGDGPAHHINYEQALDDPRAIQTYEWHAIVQILESLAGLSKRTRWLDYGCGLGGLVRYGRRLGYDIVGFDEGYAAARLAEDGVPAIRHEEFGARAGTFDVVTAIEVVEHAIDPISMLREIATLLRPSGLLFVTTGNAAPFRGRIVQWQYVQPDVHVSFFSPRPSAPFERLVCNLSAPATRVGSPSSSGARCCGPSGLVEHHSSSAAYPGRS